jgi:hypothetical protein
LSKGHKKKALKNAVQRAEEASEDEEDIDAKVLERVTMQNSLKSGKFTI